MHCRISKMCVLLLPFSVTGFLNLIKLLSFSGFYLWNNNNQLTRLFWEVNEIMNVSKAPKAQFLAQRGEHVAHVNLPP